jgi:hypothetical protein
MSGESKNPRLQALRREAKTMNRDGVKIAWKFDRKLPPQIRLQKEALRAIKDH